MEINLTSPNIFSLFGKIFYTLGLNSLFFSLVAKTHFFHTLLSFPRSLYARVRNIAKVVAGQCCFSLFFALPLRSVWGFQVPAISGQLVTNSNRQQLNIDNEGNPGRVAGIFRLLPYPTRNF